MRPSGLRPARPSTRAWALITRQSWKRGGALRSLARSMKEARSSGSNRPDRSRSAATMSEISRPNCGSSPANSVTAMGMGLSVPWVMSTSSGPLWPPRGAAGGPWRCWAALVAAEAATTVRARASVGTTPARRRIGVNAQSRKLEGAAAVMVESVLWRFGRDDTRSWRDAGTRIRGHTGPCARYPPTAKHRSRSKIGPRHRTPG